MTDQHTHHKALIAPWRQALYDFDAEQAVSVLRDLCAADVVFHCCHPLGDFQSADTFFAASLALLQGAWPDLERRDTIVMAGSADADRHWVGCCGYYTGTFLSPWLHIPPTGHQVAMRFHEFYRFDGDKLVEVQLIWDIPEVMMQAQVWPLAPSLGRDWQVPAPATQDGLVAGPYDEAQSAASCALIVEMLAAMIRHPSQGGAETMQLSRYWHPKLNWYGPAGIGTGRGEQGFRHWHQRPFIAAMPDRGQSQQGTNHDFFADGSYAAVTGWPNMTLTQSHGGWLGIAPTNKKIVLRSLDFWRIEQGLIRENWVLIDLLHMYDQIGVDVFARLQEFNRARNMAPIAQLMEHMHD